METVKLNSLTDYENSVNRAADILKSGGIVAVPTETVYGLAANCFDEKAIKNVFKAKGRPQDNPLIVHISDMEMLKKVAVDIPEIAYKCAEKFWPGPFTMVLKRNPEIPESVSAGLDTVAVRMPSEKTVHDVILKSGLPLAAPSANLSGKPSPTSANHVISDLSGKIDAVVIAGDCGVGVESTVVSLVANPPRLLRPGGITAEQLKTVLFDMVIDKAVLSEPEKGENVASPGMKYKHYAPVTETFLVEAGDNDFINFVNGKSGSAVLCFAEESDKINIKKIVYGSQNKEETLAKNVFSALRQADLLNVDKIYVHAPSKSGVGLAVYNRLIRAAAFKVIKL